LETESAGIYWYNSIIRRACCSDPAGISATTVSSTAFTQARRPSCDPVNMVLRHLTNLPTGQLTKREFISLTGQITHLSLSNLLMACNLFPTSLTAHFWCTQYGNSSKFASTTIVCEMTR